MSVVRGLSAVTMRCRPVTLRQRFVGDAHASSPAERLAELSVNLPSPMVSDGTFGGGSDSGEPTNGRDQVLTDANRRPSGWAAGGPWRRRDELDTLPSAG